MIEYILSLSPMSNLNGEIYVTVSNGNVMLNTNIEIKWGEFLSLEIQTNMNDVDTAVHCLYHMIMSGPNHEFQMFL